MNAALPPHPPTVERAAPEDLPALWALIAAIDGVAEAHPDLRTETFIYVERREILVARRGETLLGWLHWNRAFFARPFIWALGTHPDARQQGVGRALVRRVLTTAQAPKVFTSTERVNSTGQAFWEALGFVRCGGVDGLDDDDPANTELFYLWQQA